MRTSWETGPKMLGHREERENAHFHYQCLLSSSTQTDTNTVVLYLSVMRLTLLTNLPFLFLSLLQLLLRPSCLNSFLAASSFAQGSLCVPSSTSLSSPFVSLARSVSSKVTGIQQQNKEALRISTAFQQTCVVTFCSPPSTVWLLQSLVVME